MCKQIIMIVIHFFLLLQRLVSILSFDVLVSGDGTTSVPPAPHFGNPIQNVTVAVGREAILTCVVDDLGQYKVGWMRADDQTILSLHTRVVTQNTRVSVANDDDFRVWQLKIRQLREADQGCYMCQINTSSMKKQLGCIDVQVPPDIDDSATSSDVTVSESDNVTLSCTARGRPQPRILWRREDGDKLLVNHQHRQHDADKVDTFGGPKLSFLRVDRRQMGAYLCIASNDVPPAVSKRILLHVNFAPVMRVPDELVGAPLNTQVTLRCLVEAYPSTINYWTRSSAGSSDIIMNSKKHGVAEERQAYKTHMTLIVRNLLKRDLGRYVCVATNSLGRVNGSIRVYEIQLPTRQPSAMQPSRQTSKPDKTADTHLSTSSSWGAITATDADYTRVTTEVYMPIREASVELGSFGTRACLYEKILLVMLLVVFCR